MELPYLVGMNLGALDYKMGNLIVHQGLVNIVLSQCVSYVTWLLILTPLNIQTI